MRTEESFGIVPLRQTENGWEVFLVHLHAGHGGFPKGHRETGEHPLHTPERELLEETGLSVDNLLTEEAFQESYTFSRKGQPVTKTVTYYLAKVSGQPTAQKEEIAAAGWFPVGQVEEKLTFPNLKTIWANVKPFLS